MDQYLRSSVSKHVTIPCRHPCICWPPSLPKQQRYLMCVRHWSKPALEKRPSHWIAALITSNFIDDQNTFPRSHARLLYSQYDDTIHTRACSKANMTALICHTPTAFVRKDKWHKQQSTPSHFYLPYACHFLCYRTSGQSWTFYYLSLWLLTWHNPLICTYSIFHSIPFHSKLGV